MRLMLIAALAMSLPACTFVHMAPSATNVKVLAAAPACERRGEAEVVAQSQADAARAIINAQTAHASTLQRYFFPSRNAATRVSRALMS